jgi:hypothetical protein
MLAQSNNALARNARTSGINLCPSHDNEESVVMVVLSTAILVIGVVAVGAMLVYIFSWQQWR